jgi:hypothetical protein
MAIFRFFYFEIASPRFSLKKPLELHNLQGQNKGKIACTKRVANMVLVNEKMYVVPEEKQLPYDL